MNQIKRFKWAKFKKPLKISAIVVGTFFLLLFIVPFFFTDGMVTKVKDLANKNLNGEVNFSDVNLSFYRHFPLLTLTLEDFMMKGSEPFKNDTLISAKDISLGVNLKSLFGHTIQINKIFLENAFINVQVDENGLPNYNVYGGSDTVDSTRLVTDTAADDTEVKISEIIIRDTRLIYDDHSLAFQIEAKGLDYTGSGDLSKSIFDLNSRAHIKSLDLYYDKVPYFLSKEIDADLITKINTNTLAFLFERNDLKINQLPVRFTGRFEFLENGYDIEFLLTSGNTGLRELFTAMPPEYLNWLEKTVVTGEANITASLAGKYISETNIMPDLKLDLSVKNGFIQHESAPAPVENLFVKFQTVIPGFNPDSLTVNMDSVHFNIEKDYFTSVIKIKGINNPWVYASLDSEIDLEKWVKAYGIKGFEAKGQYELHVLAEGNYTEGPNPSSLRKDTVILSIPKFSVESSLKNGYFKYDSLPEPIKDMGFKISLTCDDHNYQNIRFSLSDLNAKFLDNFIHGFIETSGVDELLVIANLTSECNLADIKKVVPLDGLEIAGLMKLTIDTKGTYSKSDKQFPITNSTLVFDDVFIKTSYYPNPVHNIDVHTKVTIPTDDPRDAKIEINPFTFEFEGKQFSITASLQNIMDVKYDITANGIFDLGKIYQVFAIQGYDLNGSIEAGFTLKGKQSDATAGRYASLDNKGFLKLNAITLRSELFPMPFVISKGDFRFKQDKIWLEKFTAQYGKSDFVLDGYLGNLLDYAMNESGKIKGSFKLASNQIVVDEFMAFADTSSQPQPPAADSAAITTESGVVIIPKNLEIAFTANVKSILYQDLDIKKFTGDLEIKDGLILLKETKFTLIDAPFLMDASYGSLSPKSAFFEYHIKAEDFDIKRAYDEIQLFHDMASPAENAEGIVSLDYNLKGKLAADMMPVYPSLEGGGVLSVKKVKLNGYKMFNEVSKKTEKEGLANPDLSKLDIETTIKNNIITIEPFKFKAAGFRVKIEGESSFDGNLNLKMRLGLPPLGLFGIPVRVTGTGTMPKIRFSKGGGEDEDIPETEYSDQIPDDVAKRLKAAKETDIEEIPEVPEEIK